jgi:hypothetical protein
MKSKSARKSPKISPSEACDRAISRMLPDATESERGYIIYRALQDTGGASKLMRPQFTTCPTRGKRMLPSEAHSGGRFCRGCRAWVEEEKAVA